MIKAIIFDMDGVLVDAKQWHFMALNKALSPYGWEINYPEHLKKFDGLSTLKKLELISIPKELHLPINKMKQIYTLEMINSYCYPDKNLGDTLLKLKSDGYKLAVASNSVRDTVDLILEKTDLKKYIDFSLSNQDVENPKPHPEIYLKAIKRLGLFALECLIVEDNKNGITAALESGAHLLKVDKAADVNLENITQKLNSLK